MSPEALVLGLLSAARTVPIAIVYAFLLDDRPRRLLAAYLVSGLAVSLGVGSLALLLFEPTARSTGASTGRLVVDLIVGTVALVAAVVSRAARFRRTAEPRADGRGAGRLADRLRHPTVPVAAAAGATTNLPGLYYLAGLVAILATDPSPVGGAIQILVYNALRFAVPVLALVLVVARPDRTADTVRAAHAWGVRHRRDLLTAMLGAVGVYLVVKALTGLLG